MKKIQALFYSRRFYALAAALIVTACEELYPGMIEPETVRNVVFGIGAWIIGDSLNKTELPKPSKPSR